MSRFFTTVTRIIAFSVIFSVALSQEIVKDINQVPASLVDTPNSSDQRCVPCGNNVYFLANDVLGNELWRTDGTADGTQRVKDLNPGPGSGVFTSEPLHCLNGTLFFRGTSGSGIGYNLWKTDGTVSGTILMSSLTVGPYGPFIHGNKIVFTVSDNEIWITDGTPGNATLLKKIEYSAATYINVIDFSSGPLGLNFLIGVFNKDGSGGVRFELWSSNGTPAGTQVIKTWPYSNAWPNYLTPVENKILFVANDNTSGQELWMSDGTEAGTQMVADLTPGSNGSEIFFEGVYGNKLIFSRPGNTWVSDGTPGGTMILIPGVYSFQLKEYHGALYLLGGENSPYDNVLHKSDGTPGGTAKLDIIGNGMVLSEKMSIVNDKLIFNFQSAETGVELATSSGNSDDVTLLKDINPGSSASFPRSFAEFGNQLIFIADDGTHGYELWKTDGTSTGTTLIKDVKAGTESANIDKMYSVSNKLYFLAGTNQFSRDLWRSDGNFSGTALFKDFSAPVVFGQVQDYLIILDASRFWKTNGTPEGTTMIWDFSSVASSYGYESGKSFAAGDNLFFNFNIGDTQHEWYKANIVTNEVALLKDIYPGQPSSIVSLSGASLGNQFIFPANDNAHGEELWITDGTESGTSLLKDIRPALGSTPRAFASTEDKVFFIADDGTHGFELWVTNGTGEGTAMVKDIATGLLDGVSPSAPARLLNKIVFSGGDAGSTEPWSSDGTAAGTLLINDLNPSGGSYPTNFISINNKVYFTADDGSHGVELFVTDGTAAGTVLIDVVPGMGGSNPSKITGVGEAVYFYTSNKIWKTMGTQATTELVAEIEIFSDLNPVGNYVCFVAHHPEFSRELHRIETTKFKQVINFPVIPPKTLGQAPFQLEATASSGLPLASTTLNDKISISGVTVQLLKAGKATIEIEQQGNALFFAAEKVSNTFCVNPPKPGISVDRSNPEEPVLTSSAETGIQWFRNEVQLSVTEKVFTITEPGTYKLRIAVEDCVSEFSNPEVLVITAMEELNTSFSIFPNPTHDVIHSHAPFINTNYKIQIIDMNGKAVLERSSESQDETFDVSGFPNGNYFLRVISNGNSRIRIFTKY